MRRREFIGLAGAAAVWPRAADAQQTGRLPIVVIVGTTSSAAWSSWTAALLHRLRDLGWVEGRNIAIEYRWSQGYDERLAEIAAETMRLKPAVIVTAGTAVPALRQVATNIPIVFALGRDPVGEGMVASLARPGGNITGLSTQVTDLAAKRLDLLRAIVPDVRKVAVLAEVKDRGSLRERDEVEAAARAMGLGVAAFDLRGPEQDLAPTVQSLKGDVDAFYVGTGPLVTLRQSQLFSLALDARLPTVGGLRGYARSGGLIAYGPDYADLFRRAGDYVDKILRGAKPADIPVEQPTKFELAINMRTAKALGIAVPAKLLFTADEVIE